MSYQNDNQKKLTGTFSLTGPQLQSAVSLQNEIFISQPAPLKMVLMDI